MKSKMTNVQCIHPTIDMETIQMTDPALGGGGASGAASHHGLLARRGTGLCGGAPWRAVGPRRGRVRRQGHRGLTRLLGWVGRTQQNVVRSLLVSGHQHWW